MTAIAKHSGRSIEEVRAIMNDEREAAAVVVNELYHVNMRSIQPVVEGWPSMIWLSIKRRDRKPIHDWRDLQRIKNELVGVECEGVELYPAESRKTDTANQYHLWVFLESGHKFPFGWFVSSGGGAVQRESET